MSEIVTQRQTFMERTAACLLQRPDPVESAQPLDPDWIADMPFNDPPREAAVLIVLVPRGGEYFVVYTRRAGHLRAHSGQIAFPGGKVDAGDADAKSAALREAKEEIALVPDCAQVLGYMPTFLTGSNFIITPVVALVDQSSAFAPNPSEVDEVFEVPLNYIMEEENYRRYAVQMRGKKHSTWQLDYAGHAIWGITAYLTKDFRDRMIKD